MKEMKFTCIVMQHIFHNCAFLSIVLSFLDVQLKLVTHKHMLLLTDAFLSSVKMSVKCLPAVSVTGLDRYNLALCHRG